MHGRGLGTKTEVENEIICNNKFVRIAKSQYSIDRGIKPAG